MEKFKIFNRRYLGSKAKLVPFIKQTISEECGNFNSFADIFAGTGIVGYFFNEKDISVIVNDLLESNYQIYNAFFSSSYYDENKTSKIISDYNNVVVEDDNYFSINYKNTYFSLETCRKIGFIREDIETKYKNGQLNFRERAILITSLLYAADRIANTVGHYDAYRENGDLNKTLKLEELEIFDNSINENNKIYKLNANDLVKEIEADIVYIDPPYNSRQYCDAYHVLENIAERKKPEVFGKAKKMNRSALKSKYCMSRASLELEDLIKNIKAKYIIISYSNTGNCGAGRSQAKINDQQIIDCLSKKGTIKIFETDHNQFNAGKSKFEDHKERLFLCEVGGARNNISCENISIDVNVKSPLNYTGGKFKLLNQLLNKFPNDFSTFIDLFGGGFNVGANVDCKNIVYNDKNIQVERIIKLLYKYDGKYILEKLDELIGKYNLSDSFSHGYEYYSCLSDSGLGKYNKENFLKMRNDYNCEEKNSEKKDFILLCLIIFSFNNQIRFNSDGLFNMPVGKRDLNKSMRKNIINFSFKLKSMNIKFFAKDFSKIDPQNFEKPFVYCDPPYFLGDASYNENSGWTEEDEKDLLDYLKKINERNVRFALSNVIEHKGISHTMLKEWADKNYFNIYYINSNYTNSNYHLRNKENLTKEVIITNF